MSHRHGCLQVQLTRCHLFGRGVTSVIFHHSRYSTHLKKQQQRFLAELQNGNVKNQIDI